MSDAAGKGGRPGRFRRWRRGLAASAQVVGITGLLARPFGDGTVPGAIAIYATPWLVLGFLGAIGAGWARGRWKTGGLLLLACGVHGAVGSWRLREGLSVPDGAITVATWNAGRRLDVRPDEWRFRSDLVAVVETGSFDDREWRAFTAALPEHRWLRLDGGTLLGVRGRVVRSEDFSRHDRYRCHRVRVEMHGREWCVVVVDIRSQPWLLRDEAVTRAFEAAGNAGVPAIVMGDFNTPPDSRSIEGAKGGFRLANEAQNRGFRETWPWRLPVHTLDQIWVSPEVTPIAARHEWRASDHAQVEVTLAYAGGN